MNKPTAHLLHGFIGSGKTRFARKLENELPAIRYTHDEWMVLLYGQNQSQENFEQNYLRISELIWRQAAKVLRTGTDVVLDFGFWTKESRMAAKEKTIAAGAIPKFYNLNCDKDIMLKRALERSEDLPSDSLYIDENAFNTLFAQYEAMGPGEEFESYSTD